MNTQDTAKDLDNLRKLSYFYYFSEALSGLILLIVLGYIAVTRSLFYFGGLLLTLTFFGDGIEKMSYHLAGELRAGTFLFASSVFIGSIFVVPSLAGLVSGHFARKYLRECKHHTFSFIMAVLSSTSFPIGTAVGIPTLVILLREPVKEVFEENDRRDLPQLRESQLDLLAKLMTSYGILSVLLLFIPFVYLATGIAGFTIPVEVFESVSDSEFWAGQIVLASLIIVFGSALSVCTILAGRCLKRQSGFTFVVVTAVFLSLFAPFGTILGIWSLFLLFSDPVRTAFRTNKAGGRK